MMIPPLRIGVDVGGTKTEAVALSHDGTVLCQARVPSGRGVTQIVEAVGSVVFDLLAQVAPASAADRATVGCAVAGAVTPSGRVAKALNLGLTDVDLAVLLEERLQMAVEMENDVSAAAVAAFDALELPSRTSMVYLNVGTGLKAGIVVNGEVWRGFSGIAGEIGHVPVNPAGPACVCGQQGCLESLVSGTALGRDWPRHGTEPIVDLMRQAASGDDRARVILAQLTQSAASAIKLLTLAYDPEHIALGGGMVRGQWTENIRSILVRWERESPFLASLELGHRLIVLPGGQPYTAIGAALLGGRAAPAAPASPATA